MNQEIKTKWIEALRSDRYEQGRGRLRSKDNRYCCLGVLCDLLKPEGWRLIGAEYEINKAVCSLPHDIRTQVDLNREQTDNLMVMNDRGSTFNEIADQIEQNL